MERTWVWLFVACAAMVSAVGVLADNELHIQISEINVYNFPQLTCRILVLDENWTPMTGLTQANVVVNEDYAPQQFGMEEKIDPAALGITLDYSGSMDGQPIVDLATAANLFIDLMQPDEEASIIKFSSVAQVIQTRTADKQALHNAVNNYWPGQGNMTALYDSIVLGVNQNVDALDRGVVLAFTDGGENNSYSTLEQTYTYCINNQNVIYTLGFAGSGLDEYILRALADFTGGEYYFAPDSSMLQYLYGYISALLHIGYQLDYTTTNPTMDGSIRRVDIGVRVGDRSGWTTKYYQSPTTPAVGLTDFTAQSGIGLVYLRWRTETETDNAGFNLWRAKQAAGPYEKINASMIWGHGTTTQAHWYGYFDHGAAPGKTYFYKLEDVEYNGNYHISDPVSAPSVSGTANLLLAGWLTPRISSIDGGTLLIAAVVDKCDSTIEIYYEGLPTGLQLNDSGIDGDISPNDGVFGLAIEVPPGVAPPGEYLLELVSTSAEGVIDGRWPQLSWMDVPFVAPESAIAAPPPRGEHDAAGASSPPPPRLLGLFSPEPLYGPIGTSAEPAQAVAQAAARFTHTAQACSLPRTMCAEDILAGGYWLSAFTSDCGGRITPMVVTAGDLGESATFDVSCNGAHAELQFQDTGSSADLQAHDQVYGTALDQYLFVSPQAMVLEYQLAQGSGNRYPYLLIY